MDTVGCIGGTAQSRKERAMPPRPNQWPGRPIIHDPNGTQQMPPGHDLTRFYALLPLFAVLAVINPPAFQAVTAAAGLLATFRQLH